MSPRPVAGHTVRKRFGQNFLRDESVIAHIIRSIGPKPGEALVEIGPGLGALTQPLLAACKFLDLIEIDRDLAQRLAERFGDAVAIQTADALRYDFSALSVRRGQPLRIVGNLPYNISTPLIFHLLDSASHIRDMHFMLQKEVVDRMGAVAGEDDYGRLSVLLQYRCKVEPLFVVPPEAFTPQPKVHSAIVRLTPQTCTTPAKNELLLSQLVTTAFSQRRKTLRNAIRTLLDETAIISCNIDPAARPETLTVAQFIALADAAHYSSRTAEEH